MTFGGIVIIIITDRYHDDIRHRRNLDSLPRQGGPWFVSRWWNLNFYFSQFFRIQVS